MTIRTVIAIGAGGLVIVSLAILLIRGNFGTPQRKTRLALHELAESEVPNGAIAKGPANCLGHNSESAQLRGMGVLWLSDSTLGFVLRRPTRHFKIPVSEINSATASTSFSRVGFSQSSSEVEYLIADWTDSFGRNMIGFKLENAEQWASQIDRAVLDHRLR